MKDHRPQAHYRAQVMKFPFVHTPQMYTELSSEQMSSKYPRTKIIAPRLPQRLSISYSKVSLPLGVGALYGIN